MIVTEELIDEMKKQLPAMLVRGFVFAAMICIALYFYPQIDAWAYQVWNGYPYQAALTIYHPQRFGLIHYPTIFLITWVYLSMTFTPYIAEGIEWIIEKATAAFFAGLPGPEEPEAVE